MSVESQEAPNTSRRGFVLGAAAALGSTACVPDGINPLKWFSGGQQPEVNVEAPPPPQQPTQEPLPDMRFSSFERQRATALSLLDEARQLNEQYAQERTTTPRNELYKKAQDIVLRQALLFSQNNQYGQMSVHDRLAISLQGTAYKLDNPHDFVFASTITETLLRRQYDSDRRPQVWSEIRSVLAKNDKTITFVESDAPPFYDPEELALFLQTVRTLKEAGKPVPTKVQFRSLFSPTADAMFLKFNADGNDYNPALLDLASYYSGKIPFPGGNFYGAFEEFFNDGAGFRKRIDYAKETGRTSEYQTRQADYQALKDWSGVDISVRGKVKPPPEDYKVGQTVAIDDHEADVGRGGIHIRPYPTLDTDGGWPLIFDKRRVKLIGLPRVILEHQVKQATKMWAVEVNNTELILKTREDLYDPRPKRGWISEEWLGNVVR